MSASPELTRSSPQFVLRPVMTVIHSPEDVPRFITKNELDEDQIKKSCFTPTSQESKLSSELHTCPPAPKKPRRVFMCKRRLWSEFIAVEAKEMEELFKPRDDKCKGLWSPAKKRRSCQQSDNNKFALDLKEA